MKIKYTFFFLIFIALNAVGQGDIFFSENFDSTFKPIDWTYEYVEGAIDWKFQNGGYNLSGVPGGGVPPFAYQGENNAVFNYVSLSDETTKLITPSINMEFGIKPELRFWHAQATKFGGGTDNLKIYYKNDTSTNWNLIQEYVSEATDWVERIIQLPDSTLTDNYYIAFEGITNNGFGTCIDSMIIIETGIIGKTIESVIVSQSSTNEVPTSSNLNKILRIDFKVQGNDGAMILDSIAFSSLNTDDNDISSNGVRLYYSEDTLFLNSEEKTTGNFINGKISFDELNIILPTGFSSVWLLYDIKDDTQHNMQGHILDAYVPENGIKINNYYYPFIDKSPEGERKIVESIFNDDFETDKSWTRTPEFERETPLGYGGSQNIGSVGKADPFYATSGSYIIGTDITDDGDYENNLTNRKYQASTPSINTKHYIDTKVFFNRWINVQVTDSAYVDLSDDNGNTWINIWQNEKNYTEDSWSQIEYNINSYADRVDELKIRFALGGTDDAFPMSGWNIDDFFVTGNYLSKDVGVTKWIAPLSGCGHTDEEYVEVTIQNYSGEILIDPLIVSYSFDGGTTIKHDTIQNPNIGVDGTLNYTIDKPVDLTSPGWYNVYATTNLEGDEDSRNDKLDTVLFIAPTYNLPYSENFESNYGYFFDGGINSSWEYGIPNGTIIDTAASGTKAWVTNLNGSYQNNDSSYIETPCFSFAGLDSIILEFKCIGISENQTDGLNVMYTVDHGTTWHLVPNDHDFYWNWYNETHVSALNAAGFDETGSEWMLMRQLLPSEFSNQNSVKFRFLFESSESAIYEGFGIDDVKVYEAPADVGVSSFVEPYTACEWSDSTQVKVNIENYGITTMAVGSKIPVGLDFQGSQYIIDTLTLVSSLAPGATVEFTFTETVDMSNNGDYDFVAYTLLESNPYFYNETISNDTTSATVRVDGMPNYDLGWIVGSEDVDTLLDAGAGYDDYSWFYGGGEVATTQTYRAQAEGVYYVTVTRTNVLTCNANDSLKVVQSLIDVKMDSIRTTLKDSCLRFDSTEIWAAISNKSVHFIDGVNDTIPFGYKINNLPEVYDTLFLEGRDLTTTTPYDTISFKFETKFDLTEIGEYTISVFTNFLDDLDRTDDTVKTTINTWGLPDVELAFDTIYSSQADTLTLDAGAGFATYNWNSGSSVQTETPTNSSYYYKVTVTDVNGCGSDKDSTYIETHDLGISAVTSPVNICENLASTSAPLNVEVANYSNNVYSSPTTVKIFYNFDNQGWNEVNPELNLGATDSTILNNIATIDVTNVGTHTLKIYTSSDIDANHFNDTLEYAFETWALPDVNLAYDTIFTRKPDTVILVAQEGFATYEWSDGITSNDTLELSNLTSENYIVTVTDINGCGEDKDSTQIISYNLGITSLFAPENECSHTNSEVVKITVKNHGADTIPSGTIIPINYELNNESAVSEYHTLTEDLNSLESVTISFDTKVDLSSVDLYKFKAYIGYELDAYRKNDTLIDAIRTYGYPTIDLGNDIYTTQPETLIITADPGYNNYLWDNGSTNDSLQVTYLASRSYYVTVYDINGCTANDSVNVYTYDIAPVSLTSPVSQCELTSTETLNIDIINNSQDTLVNGDQINVSYVLNSGPPVNESFNLTDTLKPNETISYTFTQTADLSNNQLHEFNISAQFADYDAKTNDGITANVDYQKPIFDLGDPVVTGSSEYTIDAGSEYTGYLWFDNSNNQTYTVNINDQNPNHYYAVTVTNADGCEANDSIEVTFTTTADLSVTHMSSPDDDCWQQSQTYPVTIEIRNSGIVNLNPGTSFTVGYTIDEGTPVTETFNLSTAMGANDTRTHTFEDEISFDAPEIYKFKPFVKLTDDGNISNDTLTSGTSINISGPEVVLGPSDTLFFTTQLQLSTSVSYSSYLWSTGETTESIIITETGRYSVTVTDIFECQGEGDIFCEKTTGIDNIISGNGYEVMYYPNPASDKLLIDFKLKIPTDIIVEIVSSNGQVIYNTKLSNVEDRLERIDVNQFAHGVYYLRLNINQDIYIRKIIIQ